jgi:1-aminocyclopropane-1-carboxylate deaminase
MIQSPPLSTVTYNGITVDVLRLDLVHPEVSGNKWYKLHYNLIKMQSIQSGVLLTYGGLHSNHLAATAAATRQLGVASAAVIRGKEGDSPTLQKAIANGMHVFRVSRTDFRNKVMDEVRQALGKHYATIIEVPEGGSNALGMMGCSEIPVPLGYDRLCVACGTATTFGGLLKRRTTEKIIGFSVLKGENRLVDNLQPLFNELGWSFPDVGTSIRDNCAIVNNYAGAGYASFEKEVVVFAADFHQQTGLALDQVYTAKMFYGVFDLLKRGEWSASEKILLLHTGGLQGNAAFYQRYAMQMSHLQ